MPYIAGNSAELTVRIILKQSFGFSYPALSQILLEVQAAVFLEQPGQVARGDGKVFSHLP